jgi:hypothetical protein
LETLMPFCTDPACRTPYCEGCSASISPIPEAKTLPTKRTRNVRWTTLELQEISQALRFLQDWRTQQKARLRLKPAAKRMIDREVASMEGANASARAKISRLLSEPRDPNAPV